MKILFMFVACYVLFLFQVALGRFAPELIGIAIIAVAWFEHRYLSLALGFFCGLLFGLLTPYLLGIDLVIYLILGYAVSSLKNYLYQFRLLVLLAAAVVIVVRSLAIWGGRVPLGSLLPSVVLTIVVALPFWALLRKVFRWKTG